MWIETEYPTNQVHGNWKFIRQQWRMWIETSASICRAATITQFIRQQWRMWIETSSVLDRERYMLNSFASNGECGLKPDGAVQAQHGEKIHSPAMANVD